MTHERESTSPEGSGRRRGLLYILGATLVAGGLGYAIQLVAPRALPAPSSYIAFTVFWATLHFAVAVIAGVQQEVTRATSAGRSHHGWRTLTRFLGIALPILVAALVVFGAFGAKTVFDLQPLASTAILGLGVVGNLLLAVLAGVFYGLARWRSIAALTVFDISLRALFVLVALAYSAPPLVIEAAISVPSMFAVAVIGLLSSKRLRRGFSFDVSVGRLLINVGRTMLAATGLGLVVTGLPLVLKVAMNDMSAEALAAAILVVTLTRAPLIIPFQALQSYLVVEFRSSAAAVPRTLAILAALIGLISALAAVGAGIWGPFVFSLLTNDGYEVAGAFIAIVVVSAGLIALACVIGSALLARGAHTSYALSWVAIAVATVAFLFLPIGPDIRLPVALLAAPALGIGVQGVALCRRVDSRRSPSDEGP